MSDHVVSEQNGSNFLGTIATEQQVDEIGEAPTSCSDSPPNPPRSPMWPGLKPSGPAADPAGNVRTARSTSAGVTCHDPDASEVESLPRATGSGSNVCFSIKSLRFCSFGIAGGAPSHKIRTAVLILPSSSFAFTAASSAPSPPSAFCRPAGPAPPTSASVREDSSTPEGDAPSSHLVVRSLIIFVILCRLPARAGWASMEDAKSSRATQAETERGVLQMSCRVDVNAWAQDWPAPLQMCLRSGPWVA